MSNRLVPFEVKLLLKKSVLFSLVVLLPILEVLLVVEVKFIPSIMRESSVRLTDGLMEYLYVTMSLRSIRLSRSVESAMRVT